jgi:hypothetical protein
VHLSAYVNAQGNYSTYGNLLVLSTNPNPANEGMLVLEIPFHEGLPSGADLEPAAQVRVRRRRIRVRSGSTLTSGW